MKILVVEDTDDSRVLLVDQLEVQGYEVESAINGVEALEKIRIAPPDIIISDILMPVMDGFQLCRLCKEDAQLKQVPFVFYTATYVDEKDEAFAYEIGADRFILKPAEPDVLVKIIQEVIDNAAKDNLEPKTCVERKEEDTFKIYSERLVQKLEKKMLDLEKELSIRKKAEQSLEESEERFRLSFDNANIGMGLVNLEGRFLNVNKKMCDIFGYDREELENMTVFDITHPEDLDISLTFIQRAVSGEVENTAFDKKYLHKHGHTLWGKVASSIVRDIKGVPQYFITHIQDISEQKQSEKALKASEEKYRLVVENANDPIFIVQDGNIQFFNKKTVELFGVRAADLENTSFIEFVHPKYRDNVLKIYKSVLKGENQDSSNQFIIVNKSGKELWVELSIVQVFWDEKPALLNILRDLSHQKKIEAELVQAQKMESIGNLAGGVAHDYNNMLSIIIGYAEMIMGSLDADDPIYEDAVEIYKAGERSSNITRQLLTFARKETIKPIAIRLNDNIESMLKMLHRLIGENIDLAWHPDSNLWPLKIDPTQVDQILANLCVNARDAIEDIGQITIETENISFDEAYCADHSDFFPGDYVMLAVSDNGKGMEPEILNKIFEPFFTTKGFYQGTGLGLSTVYGIVKQNNGFINVYSEPGIGTTIKTYFPRHTGDAAEVYHEIVIELPVSRGETILLVEDDHSILKLAERMLKSLDYSVIAASTPGEAINLAEKNPDEIDLLITDVVMPEMNGKELSEKLQTVCSGLKTLYMSGYTANVIAQRGVLDEGVFFIPKPLSKKELAVKVRELLDKPKG